MQRVVPMLVYDDAPAALAFLCEAFGFEERFRLPMPDGRIGHAELAHGGDVVVMIASAYPEFGLHSPRDLAGHHGQLLCWVDDVDAHHARAREAGATIATPPEDQFHGSRSYRAVDPEGHRWIFQTHLRDVPVDEMRRAVENP
jgi:PhnB protein